MRFLIGVTSFIMCSVGSFIVWWGNQNKDFEIVKEINIAEYVIVILAIGGFLIFISSLG
jgi:hypothetical protein